MITLFVITWVLVLAISFFAGVFFLKFATRIVKVKVLTSWQAVKIILFSGILGFILNAIISSLDGNTTLAYLIDIVLIFAVFHWLLNKYTKVSFGKSIVVYFCYVIPLVITTLFLAAIMRVYLFQPFIADGQSMEPTYKNNDYLVTDKIAYRFHVPARGDIVIMHPQDNPDVNYIKRVIGVPGDTIIIANGDVKVNGQNMAEPYTNGKRTLTVSGSELKVTLKNNEFFVLGDDREHSRDSRELGPVPIRNIVSRVDGRLF